MRAAMPMDSNCFHHAAYLKSAVKLAQLPRDEGLEVAFVGRSNAGKSSIINALTGHRGLARTSKMPGRTRELIVFRLNGSSRLVDLPGYGFSRAPQPTQQRWRETLPAYFEKRRSLAGVVLIMDARHPLKETDESLLAWLAPRVPRLRVILNKADKLSRGQAAATLREVSARLTRVLQTDASCQLASARSGAGIEELRRTLAAWLTPSQA